MTSVTVHYQNLLAPIYLWMAGGLETALAKGAAEIADLFPPGTGPVAAVDLGAGFGMHAIPLARRGCPVIAVDSSPLLLGELARQAQGLPVKTVEDDLLAFPRHLQAPTQLILCMGDTLTHLPQLDAVRQLFALAARALPPGGRFVASFRDYSAELAGTERFIPVRSDADRILTCFLEYAADHVTVHDLLHERQGEGWQLRVSAYRKLRLAPDWVVAGLRENGFAVRVEPGLAGLLRVVATRC